MPAKPATSASAPADRRDNAYVLGLEGFIYTTHRAEDDFTLRHAGMLLVNALGAPFEVELRNGPCVQASAMLIAPLVERRLRSPHGHLVGFHVMPSHPEFQQFVRLPAPGITAIDRDALAPCNALLRSLDDGAASPATVRRHFDEVVHLSLRDAPLRPPTNPTQTAQVIELLRRSPDASLEDMAAQLKVSQRWMSRLFQQAMGMPLRDYRAWRKHRRAMELLYTRCSLTDLAHEAGFADSPHFTRAFQRWYGRQPSFTRNPHKVRLVVAAEPLQA